MKNDAHKTETVQEEYVTLCGGIQPIIIPEDEEFKTENTIDTKEADTN